MPFGLNNSPATYQLALDMVLSKFKRNTYLVYMCDVIVYSNSAEDHIRHVDEILPKLAETGVTFKMKKYKLLT